MSSTKKKNISLIKQNLQQWGFYMLDESEYKNTHSKINVIDNDGYKYLNVPIDCLVKYGCNFIFAVPLSKKLAPNADSNPDITIIDFNDKHFDQVGVWDGTLGFDAEIISERIDLGYNNGCKLLNYLRNKGVIQVTLFDKIKYMFKKLFRIKHNNKKYYCLEDISTSEEKDINVG